MRTKIFENVGGNQFKLKEEDTNTQKPTSQEPTSEKYYCIFDATPLTKLPDKSGGWESNFKCPKCKHTLHINKDGGWSYEVF